MYSIDKGEKMEERRVVVSGIGVIAGNGAGKEAFFKNLCEGKSGLKKCDLFSAKDLRTEYVGEIGESDFPYLTDLPSEKERVMCIIEKAVDEAFSDAKLTAREVEDFSERAYLAFATSLAANGRILKYVSDNREGKYEPEWLTQIPSFVPWIKKKCGIKGGCYTTMAACASGTTAAGIAFDLIKAGKADLVICGGADPLTEFSCLGFNALKSLSENTCKPFDKMRDGINIGEGGAFFVIETFASAKARGATIYGEIIGYGINNDAYHITSPSPTGDGAIASMTMAMAHTEVGPDQVSYVNAHGTGTQLNDKMEALAINRFFEKTGDRVYVSTNKSMIGHCMAAAGSIEMAATLLCLKHGKVTRNIGIEDMMDECDQHVFPLETVDAEISYAFSNSFAFAGNAASILLGRCHEE